VCIYISVLQMEADVKMCRVVRNYEKNLSTENIFLLYNHHQKDTSRAIQIVIKIHEIA